MAVPKTNISVLKLAHEIGLTVSSNFKLKSIFTAPQISGNGLDPAYCSGTTGQARLSTLQNSATYKVGRFRNYKYGLVFFIANGTIYNYDMQNETITTVAGIPPSRDIAMTDTKLYSFNNDTYPTSFNEFTIFQAGPTIMPIRQIPFAGSSNPTSMSMLNDSVIMVGGINYINFYDITGSNAVLTYSMPIQGAVVGDMVYMENSDAILVLELKDLKYYITKYNTAGSVLQRFEIAEQCFGMFINRDFNALFGESWNVYVINSSNQLFQVDLKLELLSLVKNLTIPHIIYGADNTIFNMRKI